MACFARRSSGPCWPSSEFASLDEALRMANDSIYGLSSAIFTRNLATARSVHRRRSTLVWRTLISTPATRSRRCRLAASSSRAPACPRTARAGWSSSSIGRPYTCGDGEQTPTRRRRPPIPSKAKLKAGQRTTPLAGRSRHSSSKSPRRGRASPSRLHG